ncbi:MAG: prolyl oligopeptidase family serine peptidase [Chitinophagaceae bacterium]|nr:prolyl oligopeptidase family serine peptidase [Chitinophagaceae bacterium]
MRKNIITIALLVCSTIMFAQTKPRPQTPAPPFDYIIDSVEYDNTDRSVHLGATLSYPKTKEPFTTVIMITGSGQQDRDETILGHKPFAVIADYLTKQGLAVLRVDDRMRGKSKGNVLTATSADYAEDVMTSINYLLTRKEVDKNKIGVIGHSEGGFIAPMIYTKFPTLAFIVSLAGTGISGAEILQKQQTDPLKNVVSEKVFNAYADLTKQTLTIIHDNYSLSDSLILESVKNVFTKWKMNNDDSTLIKLNAKNVSAEVYANQQIKAELIPWYKYFIATEPDQFWSRVKCPVLALNGEKDIQVYPEQNITAIIKAVNKGGNKNITTKIFPGLNHLFQRCTKCTIQEYAELEETFSPEVLIYIKDWLKEKKFI